MNRLRVLLAEDHKDMRERILRMLERDFDVVGTVSDGRSLLEAESKMKPDICIVDISMPLLGGIDAAIELKKRGSQARIVFLTVHDDPDFVRVSLEAGASAYVLKSRMASDLRTAIKAAMAGRLFVSPFMPYVSQGESDEDLNKEFH